MCGEKLSTTSTDIHPAGSPPRMRGKGRIFPRGVGAQGITPAYAGKRPASRQQSPSPRDHPRVCGEKPAAASSRTHTTGSPPRMRGKGVLDFYSIGFGGITPAYAGKSLSVPTHGSRPGDHPRVCGEKPFSQLESTVPPGSPPRMRGKAEPERLRQLSGGITPACAGKSSIQHLTASLGEFKVQKGHPVPHLRQRLQVWPDHARHLRHGLILHASRSAGQGRRLCPGPCPDTAGSGTPRGPSPAKRPHTSPPAATPGGCRPWQSGATAPGSR